MLFSDRITVWRVSRLVHIPLLYRGGTPSAPIDRVSLVLSCGSEWGGAVKGKTENQLLRMPLDAYMFRPGFIQPLRGVRSKTRVYQAIYRVLGPFYPLLKRLMPKHVTTAVNMGRAMIEVAAQGYTKRVLENPDINSLAVAV